MLSIKKTLLGCAVSIFITTSAFATNVSPFTDNIRVNLKGFPVGGVLYINYQNDNGLYITGPTSIGTVLDHYSFTISSQNFEENGYPSMTINSCKLEFVDGPWVELGYRTQSPPSCPQWSVGQIQQDGQYQYHIDIAYKGP